MSVPAVMAGAGQGWCLVAPGDEEARAALVDALVAGQDVEPAEGSDGSDGRWRIAARTAGQVNHPRRYRLRHRRAARAPPGRRPPGSDQTASAAASRPRRLHHRRLHHRRPGHHGHLPGRAHGRPGPPQADGNRQAQFKTRCRGCPLRERCTTATAGRVLTIHPQHTLLAAARHAAAGPAWQDEYRRWRPSVERAIAWLVAHGNRRVPYRGVTKNNNWLHHRAAALNLRRLVNLGATRTSDGNWALA